MSLTKLLPVFFTVILILSTLIGNYGEGWGISEQHVKTTEGLLLGLSMGLLAWFGFALWQGGKPADK